MVDDITTITYRTLILRKVRASQKDRDGCFYTSHRQRVRSHYYIAPYYNARSEGLERFKWQKIRRTREEAWSMDGSLRSITATIRWDHVDRGNAVATVWKFAWIRMPLVEHCDFSSRFSSSDPSRIIYDRIRGKFLSRQTYIHAFHLPYKIPFVSNFFLSTRE